MLRIPSCAGILLAAAPDGGVDGVTVSALDTGWISDSGEPWTACRELLDLDHQSPADSAVEAARLKMIDDSAVLELVDIAGDWPGYALKRHNESAYPLYAIATLADFGLERRDPGIEGFDNALLEAIYYRCPVLINRYPVYRADIEPKGLSLIEIDGAVTTETVTAVRTWLSDERLRSDAADTATLAVWFDRS